VANSRPIMRKFKIPLLRILNLIIAPHIDGKNRDLVSIVQNLIMDNIRADYPIIVVHYDMGKEPLRFCVEDTLRNGWIAASQII